MARTNADYKYFETMEKKEIKMYNGFNKLIVPIDDFVLTCYFSFLSASNFGSTLLFFPHFFAFSYIQRTQLLIIL